jgi:hypothetical protein
MSKIFSTNRGKIIKIAAVLFCFIFVLFGAGTAHAVGSFYTGQAAMTVLGQTSLNPSSVTYGDTAITLYAPFSSAFDSSGNLWVVDRRNHRILEYPTSNLVTDGAATMALGQTSLNPGSVTYGDTAPHYTLQIALPSTPQEISGWPISLITAYSNIPAPYLSPPSDQPPVHLKSVLL